jgi:hypothetical protein
VATSRPSIIEGTESALDNQYFGSGNKLTEKSAGPSWYDLGFSAIGFAAGASESELVVVSLTEEV